MRKFNIEEAKAGKTVCTRDGRNARIICFDAKRGNYPIVALIDDKGVEYVSYFSLDGKYDNGVDSNDLFMKPEKHKGYVNIYRNELGCNYPLYQVMDRFTKEQAQDRGKMRQDYITTVEIEWEE